MLDHCFSVWLLENLLIWLEHAEAITLCRLNLFHHVVMPNFCIGFKLARLLSEIELDLLVLIFDHRSWFGAITFIVSENFQDFYSLLVVIQSNQEITESIVCLFALWHDVLSHIGIKHSFLVFHLALSDSGPLEYQVIIIPIILIKHPRNELFRFLEFLLIYKLV